MKGSPPPLTAAIFLLLLSGCGREASQIIDAVETFVDFGMSNEERPLEPVERARSLGPHVRSRSLDSSSKRGATLRVDYDLDHHLEGAQVEQVLSTELDRLLDDGDYARIRVRAMPAGLVRYGGLMGTASADRLSSGEVRRTLRPLINEEAPALSEHQHKALVDLELAVARAPEGRRSEAEQRQLMEERHGAEVLSSAIDVAKRRFGKRPRP